LKLRDTARAAMPTLRAVNFSHAYYTHMVVGNLFRAIPIMKVTCSSVWC